eukprot:CAMPEP_0174295158 /NCGR_PEP_ID=MMETSP0809-20121228/43824_1 /TAXON_ID=73025 ORGANISM="Eutreptiella gymnastica-like, Strain CCMP1594" /NCGR_SAMPLE_ID=MMETSP0809 /ASSEMBLY_ACC=CAM_ASM_000658 /LENGTH=45 /DNA_ID= /DNA_START= /DNA_END= /DNA_ORIENTATION=
MAHHPVADATCLGGVALFQVADAHRPEPRCFPQTLGPAAAVSPWR